MQRAILASSVILFCIGCTLMIGGTVNFEENLPVRISFFTYPKYSDEINSFFNRTVSTPSEDAQNKLVGDYQVAGYLILPKKDKPVQGFPVIIWLHGFGVSADIQINYPRQFARSGFLTLALDQPGHGWSGGYWDLGIQTLLGIYSAIEWLVNDSNYRDLIDITRIGISGHSMGGIATTRAGIFDNWINPRTGKNIGTGRIRSSSAVFCWDDLEQYTEDFMQDFIRIERVWSQPTIVDIFTYWRWLSNHDPNGLEEELAIRSVSNFMNSSNIKNYCLIVGGDEHPLIIKSHYFIAANATKNATGSAQITWNEISDTIRSNANNTWDFGNKTNQSARRLVIVPGIGHIGEAISLEVVRNITTWFDETMDCTDISPTIPDDFQTQYLLKMLGWILTLVGTMTVILPSFSYISNSRFSRKTTTSQIAPNLLTKEKKYLLSVYLLGSVILISLSGIVKLYSVTHFWMFDILFIPSLLAISTFLLIPTVILVFFEKRKFNYQSQDIGLSFDIKINLQSVLSPVIVIGFWVALFNLTAWIFQVPLLLPRPFELEVFFDFSILLVILLLFNFIIELIFRGLYQTKIQQKNGEDTSPLIIILKSGSVSGLCIGLGLGTNLLITLYPLFVNAPFYILILYGIIISIFLLLGLIAAAVYHTTGNIFSSTVLNTLIMALFISGKLFLAYA
ncbi:MAG: alpha/beta hydrolase family protein [Candidatus Hodarchaeales archaeon]